MKARSLNLPLLVMLFAPVLACSCSRIPGKLLVMEGNFLQSQGMYTEAISSYLKALEFEEAAPYAEYGLGAAYYSLDEGAAALGRFADSRKLLETLPAATHRELRYRNNYNTGVVLFGQGDFSAAAASFREALRSDPGRIDAKRNLELSLRSLAADNAAGGRTEQRRAESETRDALFDYLRQREQNQWKSREWTAEEQTEGPDY